MNIINFEEKRKLRFSQCNICKCNKAKRKEERDNLNPEKNHCFIRSLWWDNIPRTDIYTPYKNCNDSIEVTCENFFHDDWY